MPTKLAELCLSGSYSPVLDSQLLAAEVPQEETATGKVDYNYDMTDFPSEEGPGFSVFYKDQDGNVFHTYLFAERLLNLLWAVQQ
jgi:predicted dithiol-disulfide oxidoreductase (DUF899 family)